MKKFSILICSLDSRWAYLNRLLERLKPQMTDEVEVLVNSDRREVTIGAKRNMLVSWATGQYVAFVDDDDLVSEKYTSKILRAIRSEPDCVGIEGTMTTDGVNPKKFIHSIKYRNWFERNGIYYRCCNHLNPIRKDIVVQVPFPEINSGEDHNFSMMVKPLLHKESYISEPIYFYEFRTRK